jgi:hypothetical protein
MRSYGGMSLEDVRNMDYKDFQAHLRLCLIAEQAEREFKMNVMGIATGAGPAGKKSKGKYRKGGGTIRDTITENIKLTKPLTKEDLV